MARKRDTCEEYLERSEGRESRLFQNLQFTGVRMRVENEWRH